MTMLWDQHRDRYQCGDYTIRRITYCKFRELTRNMTEEDMAKIGRLNAKRESGAELTADETAVLTEIAGRWPIDDLRGACFIPPVTGQEAQTILAELPRKQSEELENMLDRFTTPEVPAEDTADPLAAIMVASGGLGIDFADMTVGQGFAVVAMLKGGNEQ